MVTYLDKLATVKNPTQAPEQLLQNLTHNKSRTRQSITHKVEFANKDNGNKSDEKQAELGSTFHNHQETSSDENMSTRTQTH